VRVIILIGYGASNAGAGEARPPGSQEVRLEAIKPSER
jgi:hypothetical protein